MRSRTAILIAMSGVLLAAGLIQRELAKRKAAEAARIAAPASHTGSAGASGRIEATTAPDSANPLPGRDSVAGLQALADTVRARALRGDTLGLIRLLIDDTLFRRHVWPSSPAYDPTRESVFQFVRGMDKANNAKGLRRMLHDVQTLGASGVPDAIAFDTTPAAGGTLYILKPVRSVRLFGGALAVNGVYRVLNYSESGASQGALASE